MKSHCVFVSLLFAIAMSGGMPLANATVASKRSIEVVMIATLHLIMDKPKGCTPGHLRALGNKVRPDVFAVEACRNPGDV